MKIKTRNNTIQYSCRQYKGVSNESITKDSTLIKLKETNFSQETFMALVFFPRIDFVFPSRESIPSYLPTVTF